MFAPVPSKVPGQCTRLPLWSRHLWQRVFAGHVPRVSPSLSLNSDKKRCEFVVSIICESGESDGAVSEEVEVSAVDISQSAGPFDIHGSSSSGHSNFAFKVRTVVVADLRSLFTYRACLAVGKTDTFSYTNKTRLTYKCM